MEGDWEPEGSERSDEERAVLERRIAAAVEEWTKQLIDVSANNRLLYYRDLRQGTLSLDDADPDATSRLLSDGTVRLSELFYHEESASFARQARAVRAKATENFEERGLQTLFMAWGMATWTEESHRQSVPAAPVLLRELHLNPRGGAAEDFDLTLVGEWELNPTLLHLLDTRFDVHIDIEEKALFAVEDTGDAQHLFELFSKGADEIEGFEFVPRIVIGNFSYAKLPMVRDLKAGCALLTESALVAAIAGDEKARADLRARFPNDLRDDAPDRTPPEDEFLVIDADASQNFVINAVLANTDLVCIGPPGTGKSQTIANLIASLSARGKTVLFVAEKRAAIDVVINRLRGVGLSDLVMDVHGGTGSRRLLAEELSGAITAASNTPLPNLDTVQERVGRRREELRGYAESLHEVRDPWGLSVYELQAQLIGIDASTRSELRLSPETLRSLTADAFRMACEELDRFVVRGGFDLASSTSSWAQAFASESVTTAEAASEALATANTLATATLPYAVARLRALAAETGLAEPATLDRWDGVLTLVGKVAQIVSVFRPEIFSLNLRELAAQVAPAGRGTIPRATHRLTDGRYRRARKTLRSLARDKLPRGRALTRLVEAAAKRAERWASGSTRPGPPLVPAGMTEAEAAYRQLLGEVRHLSTFVGYDLSVLSFDDLAEWLKRLRSDQQTLFKVPELCRLRKELLARGLGPLLEEMRIRKMSEDQSAMCLRHVWMSSILETVRGTDPRIGAFDVAAHMRAVEDFRDADRNHMDSAPLRIHRSIAEAITTARDTYPEENRIIAKQASLKRGHKSTRWLFENAPHVLLAAKPCWAMSPLVVSHLLPLRRLFDVVIFDEASQVEPADAIGAFMRAERAVVAGDHKQLPPTHFFVGDSDETPDDEDNDEEGGVESALTQNIESVLDQMRALLPVPYGTRELRWHYRSRDERLIAFSNAQPQLYEGKLITFPGVSTQPVPTHHRISFASELSDVRALEVAKVVELVAVHAEDHPEESLGVIALGIIHANRIDEALRQARKENRVLDEFMDKDFAQPGRSPEKFFVKNLERVQGDERDAVIMTLGYGKRTGGRLSHNFGPVNHEGGERRLNVAITRARSAMTVVSSFSAADIDPDKLTHEGGRMLARYLAYAESEGRDLGPYTKDGPILNPFEIDVRDRLAAAGIPLVAQYGVSGYWIDFAARHPTQPGKMVLAIEADGVSYHSSQTARDRDRLRQQHLENLGWVFHRIWSTAWFHNHEAEIARALESYKQAVERADGNAPVAIRGSDGPGAALASTFIKPSDEPEIPQRIGNPPRVTGEPITSYSSGELIALIRWIKSDTLPRTRDELIAEATTYLGFKKRGSRIVEALTAAVSAADEPDPPTPSPSPPPRRTAPHTASTPRPYRGGRGRSQRRY